MKKRKKCFGAVPVCMLILSCSLAVNVCAEEDIIIVEESTVTESLFSSLPENFTFSSGAGAWFTEITLAGDGTFTGEFHDSEMGDIGEGYPNGTVYICNFSGKFSQPEMMDSYTYSMDLEYIDVEQPVGETYYENDVRYVCWDPYGFDNADQFYIYLPGKSLESIPEGFLAWSHIDTATETVMPANQYGIYNVGGEQGFVGFLETAVSAIDAELRELEEYDAQLQALLNSDISQEEIDKYTGQLYTIWDDKLNEIWGELKNTLDPAAMDQLTDEEIQWINEKERDAAQASSGLEESRQYAAYTQRAYEWTKERVYVLAGYLPKGEQSDVQNTGESSSVAWVGCEQLHDDNMNEYAVITGYDSEGAVVWSFSTGSYMAAQLPRVTGMGSNNGIYYYCEDGTICAVDYNTGEILWVNSDFTGSATDWVFDTQGNLYVCGYLGPDLFVVSSSGETLYYSGMMDEHYYWAYDLEWYDDSTLMITYEAQENGESGPFSRTFDVSGWV